MTFWSQVSIATKIVSQPCSMVSGLTWTRCTKQLVKPMQPCLLVCILYSWIDEWSMLEDWVRLASSQRS